MIEGLLAASVITLIIICLIGAPLLILYIVAAWKLYKKCGREGWEGIIPIYSDYVLIQITGIKWWAIFILVVGYFTANGSGIGFVLSLLVLFTRFCIYYNLSKKMGKDPIGFGIGLTLLPIVFIPILAFGSSQYTDCEVSAFGVIPEDKVSSATENVKETVKKTAEKSTTSKGAKFCTNCGAELTGGKFCSKCGHEIH